MSAPGVDDVQLLQEGGATQEQIGGYIADTTKMLYEGGARTDQIEEYFGSPPFDPKPITTHIDENIKQATAPATDGAQPKPITSFVDALEAGLQISVSGLMLHGKPTTTLSPDASRVQRVASQIGTLAGDIPFMSAGFFLGGGPASPVTGMAGGFALPQGMRKILVDKYDNGEATTFADFWDRLSGATVDTLKGLVVGAATGAAGKLVGAAPIVSPTAKMAAQTSAEIGTMVTVGSALEGHVPNADEFIDTALTLGFLKGTMAGSKKLMKIYQDTGVRPRDVVADAQRDPTILQDVLSRREIPRAYENLGEGKTVGADQGVNPSVKDLAKAVETPIPEDKPVERPALSSSDSEKAILSKIVQTDPVKERLTLREIYTSVVDNLDKIKWDYERAGVTKPVSEDAYALMRLTRGLAARGKHWMKFGPVDFNTYDTVGRGYEQILEPVKNDLDGFRAYMVSKRVIEKEGQGIKTGFDLEAAKQVVKDGAKKYEAVHQERLQYRAKLLDYLEGAGILNRADRATFEKANKDYVGFHRYFEDGPQSSTGGGGIKNPIKKMKGSERDIIDPIMSDIKDTFLFVSLAERNAARQTYVNGLGPAFAEKQPTKIAPVKLTEPEIRKLFDEFITFRKQTESSTSSTTKTSGASSDGAESQSKSARMMEAKLNEALLSRGYHKGEAEQIIRRVVEAKIGKTSETVEKITKEMETTTYIPEIDIRLPNSAATVFRALKTPIGKDEMAVMENGKLSVYKVDPKTAEAFEDLDRVSTSMVANAVLHAPAAMLRAGVVLRPEFQAMNLVRDAFSSFVYAGSNPINTAKGFASLITQDEVYQKWLKSGGGNATMVAIDRNYLSQELTKLNTETGLMERSWNVMKTPWHLLHAISEGAENSTRLGAIRSEMQQAKTKAQIQALGMMSRESTVDFARHGRDTQEFAKMTAFFNPSVQGIDKFMRAMKENPAATSAKAFASLTVPSLLLWWANKEDKEIGDLPAWEKIVFWHTRVPLPGGGTFIARLPKPQELGIIFATLPAMLAEEFFTDNPEAFKGFNEAMMSQFVPNMIPTAPIAVIEQFSNRSMFTGGPLVPSNLEQLLPEYHYGPYTTETAKAIGQIIGAFPGIREANTHPEHTAFSPVAKALSSPILIENYVRAWTGGLGLYVLQLADKGLREAGVVADPPKPILSLADVPVVKAFVSRYPSASVQSIQDFYTEFYAEKKFYDTAQHILRTTKDGEGLDKVVEFTEKGTGAELDGIRTTLSDQHNLINRLYGNPNIPKDEQRQLIDEIYYTMIQLAQAGNETIRQMREARKSSQNGTNMLQQPAGVAP